ncbi:MAG: hypothetical protein IT176_11075 [Acidobacteria bacterium]|nr:hypothetical protein [Acidobacteriota bacterium]
MRASLLGATCLAVLATHVHFGFSRVRLFPQVPAHAVDVRSVVVPLPDMERLAGIRAAIVLRVRGGAQAAPLSIALDDHPIAQAVAPAGRQVRVDASAGVLSGPGHRLTVASDRAGWHLDGLEVANVHGFSTGLLNFAIVPRGGMKGAPVPPWAIGLAAFGLLMLSAVPQPILTTGPATRAILGAAAGIGLVFFGAVLLLGVATPFDIRLSARTFLLGAALIHVDRLAAALVRSRPVLARAFRACRPFIPHAAAVAMVGSVVWGTYQPGRGFTALVRFGEQFDSSTVPSLAAIPHVIVPGAGYDGQFYAQLALDPGLRGEPTRTALDDAGYRSRRILLPLVAHVLGLGQPRLIIEAYALLNVFSWLALGWLLLQTLPAGAIRPTAAWLMCMLGEGIVNSIRWALLDGPSMALLALGILAFERNRRWLACAVMGVSGLAREVNLLGGAVLLPAGGAPRRAPGRTILRGLLLIGPFAAWMLYLHLIGLPLGSPGGGNFRLPLEGYAQKWIDTVTTLHANGWGSEARFSLFALIALTTQAVTLIWRREWRQSWWRLGIAYVGLMTLLGPAVWEGEPAAAVRVLIPMTFAFNVLLTRGAWFWPLLMLGNLNVLHVLYESGLIAI